MEPDGDHQITTLSHERGRWLYLGRVDVSWRTKMEGALSQVLIRQPTAPPRHPAGWRCSQTLWERQRSCFSTVRTENG